MTEPNPAAPPETPSTPPEPQPTPAPPDNQGDPPARTFTQDEVNTFIARETKKAVQKAKDDAAAEAAKAQMTEAEKLKAERDEAHAKVTEAEARANKRIVTAEAKAALARAGVKPEAADYAINALGDLSDIAVDDNGEPDAVALKAKIDGLLTATPQLLSEPGTARGGSEFKTPPGKEPITDELIGKMPIAELEARRAEIDAYLANQR